MRFKERNKKQKGKAEVAVLILMRIRYHRRSHRVGRLSSEEKAKRLAQMTQDATDRHQQATAKIEQAEKRDQAELVEMKKKMEDMDGGQGAAQEIATAVAGWVNKSGRKLEESIASRRYYSQDRRNEKFRR